MFGDAAGTVEPSPRVIERPGETHTLLFDGSSSDPQPVVNLNSGGAALPGNVGDVSTLAVAGGGLPLTGAGLVALIGMGLSLLSSGVALRRVPWDEGVRRPRGRPAAWAPVRAAGRLSGTAPRRRRAGAGTAGRAARG